MPKRLRRRNNRFPVLPYRPPRRHILQKQNDETRKFVSSFLIGCRKFQSFFVENHQTKFAKNGKKSQTSIDGKRFPDRELNFNNKKQKSKNDIFRMKSTAKKLLKSLKNGKFFAKMKCGLNCKFFICATFFRRKKHRLKLPFRTFFRSIAVEARAANFVPVPCHLTKKALYGILFP